MSFNPSLPKVVIDTNIWISAIFWGGKPRKVIEAWTRNKFYLIISPALKSELLRTIEEKAKILEVAPNFVLSWLEIVSEKAVIVYPKEKVEICRHPKDNVLLEASLESRADFLVTGDKDLLILKTFKKTRIIRPVEFLKLL